MHVDGAVISQSINQLGSFFDLERVEVLRGPQGTLYGRNATGGVINLITAKPTSDLSGYIRATYGNYDQFVTEGAISGPLTSGIRMRLAARTEDRKGFGHNPVIGTDVDDANKRSVRATLDFDISSNASFLLTGELHQENDAAYGLHFKEISFFRVNWSEARFMVSVRVAMPRISAISQVKGLFATSVRHGRSRGLSTSA